MNLQNKLSKIQSVFIDTAPIIYFVEGHHDFGQRVKNLIILIRSLKVNIYTSTITLTELLPKPVSEGNTILANKFINMIKDRKYLKVLDIDKEIAIAAGILQGNYAFLKSLDAIQIAAAVNSKSDIFLTNDKKLKVIKEIEVWIMDDLI